MLEGIMKHPELPGVSVVPYSVLCKTRKDIREVAMELNKGHEIYICRDEALRAYLVSPKALQVVFR